MKTKVEVECYICDHCLAPTGFAYSCQWCGKHFCEKCFDFMVWYNDDPIESSRRCGYCVNCDLKLRESRDDPSHKRLLRIKELEAEMKAFFARYAAELKEIEDDHDHEMRRKKELRLSHDT